MEEREEEVKSRLMKVKEVSEKAGLKLNSKNTKVMAYGPSFQGKQMGYLGKQWKEWAPKSLQMVTTAMKSKDTCSLEEKL